MGKGLSRGQVKECHAVIHAAASSAGAVGAGFAQIPVADAALITPIQIGMIIALGAIFGVKVTQSMAQAIISGCGAAFIGRGVVQLVIGWVPGVGNIVNTATAAGLTEAIGWLAVRHFSQNDTAEARRAGFEEACQEFEAKFQRQAEEFLRRECVHRAEMDEYEDLLSAYEARIRELGAMVNRTSEEEAELQQALQTKGRLDQLPRDDDPGVTV